MSLDYFQGKKFLGIPFISRKWLILGIIMLANGKSVLPPQNHERSRHPAISALLCEMPAPFLARFSKSKIWFGLASFFGSRFLRQFVFGNSHLMRFGGDRKST